MNQILPFPGGLPVDNAPPVNYEAEQALLGAILADNRAYDAVNSIVAEEHFADPINGRIFEVAGLLIERGRKADAITLKHAFEARDDLNAAGGTDYLVELQGNYVSLINARDYAKTIRDLWLRRCLMALGEDLQAQARDGGIETSPGDLLEAAAGRLDALEGHGRDGGGMAPFTDALGQALASTEAAVKARAAGEVIGIPTGLVDLDAAVNGLRRAQLTILAGRPAMGKTPLAHHIATHNAAAGRVVAWWNGEMSNEELGQRQLAMSSGVGLEAIMGGNIDPAQFDRLVDVERAHRGRPLFIDETPGITVAALQSRFRQIKRRHGLDLVVIDYLQLLRGPTGRRQDNRTQEVSEISRSLKEMAKTLNVPVLALSQLNRDLERREDKRPQMSDLRESGTLEQDADRLLMLYREEYYLNLAPPQRGPRQTVEQYEAAHVDHLQRLVDAMNIAEVIIPKQRMGGPHTVKLRFEQNKGTFSNLWGGNSAEPAAGENQKEIPF